MTDVVDLTEVFSETLARVRARMDADANSGVTTSDPNWIDTREGTFYWDMTQPSAMECARLWDAMTETVAAAFPSTAWGDYLDEHGQTFNLTRTPAAPATGSLLFIATAATLIAAGTQASTLTSSTGDTVTFATTASGTTSPVLAVPSSVLVTAAQTGGYLVAGTRYYHVTAVNQYGETTGSADQVAITTTNTGVNTITWAAVVGDYSNLIANPSFEYDTPGSAPAAWSAAASSFILVGATLTVVTTQAQDGKQGLQIVTTVTNNFEGAAVPLSGTFQAGVPYTFSVQVKGNAGGETVNVGVGVLAGNDYVSTNVTLTTGWQRVSLTWTPTANESANAFAFVRNNGAKVQTYFMDAAILAQSAAAVPFANGDSPGMAWSGTAGNSVSNPVLPVTYNVYTTQAAGSMGALLASAVQNTIYADNGSVTPNAAVPEPQVNTTSGILLAAQAITAGSAGDVGAGAVVSLDTVIPTVLSVTNPNPMTGGSEEESDDDFRARILGEYVGTSGGGNTTDYKRWAASQGIARTTVVPVWNGAGTVLVIAMNADGSPVSSQTVAALQAFLDPYPGQGAGQAPIGATVTVTTSTVRTITISAGVKGETGYTLDGTAGTIATRSAIMAALTAYTQSLQPGDTLVYTHALATFFVPGVHQVINLQINGGSSDITLGSGLTPQVASLGAVTLTDA